MDYTDQINALQIQINSIDAQVNAPLSTKVKAALIANKSTLQTWYSQLVSGVLLTDAQSAQLQTDLSNAKKATLAAAASADQTKMIIIGAVGVLVIGVAVWLFTKKRQAAAA